MSPSWCGRPIRGIFANALPTPLFERTIGGGRLLSCLTMTKPTQLPSLTALRIVAASLVFFSHGLILPIFADTGAANVYGLIAHNMGAIGVLFFFILSGPLQYLEIDTAGSLATAVLQDPVGVCDPLGRSRLRRNCSSPRGVQPVATRLVADPTLMSRHQRPTVAMEVVHRLPRPAAGEPHPRAGCGRRPRQW
jgi:hypothetical protein